jgi:hypothetical protein
MVKKIKANGSPCRKCVEVMQRLEKGGHLEAIDRILIADERDPDSDGWTLARRHHVNAAPFFVVNDDGVDRVYTVYFRLVREVLQRQVNERDELAELLEANPELDFI